jgi:DNA invertase Pin-like site-specific DNA recombinase
MPKPKKVALYARVSTDGQSTENQLRELRAAISRHDWTIVAEYVDRGFSGAKGRKDRPRFDALLHGVARKEFDMIAAWSVDRLGRSLQDLVGFLGDLQSKKIDLYRRTKEETDLRKAIPKPNGRRRTETPNCSSRPPKSERQSYSVAH